MLTSISAALRVCVPAMFLLIVGK